MPRESFLRKREKLKPSRSAKRKRALRQRSAAKSDDYLRFFFLAGNLILGEGRVSALRNFRISANASLFSAAEFEAVQSAGIIKP
jgi:hypothetical protein